jgi:hypothetical protein
MLRPSVCARCQSTWVPDSDPISGPRYCPLCQLQTTPVSKSIAVLNRRFVQNLFTWFSVAGIPLLVLAMVLAVTMTRAVSARRAVAVAGPWTLTVHAEESAAAFTASSLEPQTTVADIEIIGPPHEIVVVAVPPPQIPADEEAADVAEAAPAPAPQNPAPAVANNDSPKVCEKPSGMFGTSLFFAANPTEATKQAAAKDKIVFLLHVSGDFDDPGFT